MGSAQFGKTEILLNVTGYFIDEDPAPMLIVEPTLDVGKAFSKDRLATMIRDTDCLTGKVKDSKAKDSDNTILHKSFPGGHITIAGANSAASLRARPIRVALMDDIDAFPKSAGTEGNPCDLTVKRTTTFWNRKIGKFSTPTIEGSSQIELAYEQSDKRKYWVPCPHCGVMQILLFPQLKWPKDHPEQAAYECPNCKGMITDALKTQMIRHGEWRAENAFNGKAGFWINELYSPWVPFADMAQRWVNAQGDLEKLQVFINTSLGEVWKQTVINKKEEEILSARCALPPQVAPISTVALTCGIDMQFAGFWYTVWAWAATPGGITGWLIHYGFVPTWLQLESILYETEYLTEDSNVRHRIWRAAIDTGGGSGQTNELSMTEDCYWWIVRNAGRGVQLFGTKGASNPIPGTFRQGNPLMKTPTGKTLPPWFSITLIDTDQMKDYYHRGIEQAVQGGANSLFLHSETDSTYAKHILAEQKIINPKTKAMEWIAKGDNHLFDSSILGISLAHRDWVGGGAAIIRRGSPGAPIQEATEQKKVQVVRQPVKSNWMK